MTEALSVCACVCVSVCAREREREGEGRDRDIMKERRRDNEIKTESGEGRECPGCVIEWGIEWGDLCL